MNLENIEIAPNLSFKPIESDPSSCDSFDAAHPISPTDIFRDTPMGGEENNDTDLLHCQCVVRRANPIGNSQSGNNNEANSSESHLISPFPFTPTASKEELEEREMLTSSLRWEAGLDGGGGVEMETFKENQPTVHVDFSRFFEPVLLGSSNIDIMDCDDFSLSSDDERSLSVDLATISKDPESFWEESIAVAPSTSGNVSPTQVSLGSVEPADTLGTNVPSNRGMQSDNDASASQ